VQLRFTPVGGRICSESTIFLLGRGLVNHPGGPGLGLTPCHCRLCKLRLRMARWPWVSRVLIGLGFGDPSTRRCLSGVPPFSAVSRLAMIAGISAVLWAQGLLLSACPPRAARLGSFLPAPHRYELAAVVDHAAGLAKQGTASLPALSGTGHHSRRFVRCCRVDGVCHTLLGMLHDPSASPICFFASASW